MTKKSRFFSLIVIIILIAGCKGPAGPAGPSLTGSITGVIQLYDSTGNMPVDRSGVTVSIQGTPTSTTTDSLGHWSLNGLTTGSYTIVETKPGYGMTEQQNVQLVSGTVVDAGTIGREEILGGDIIMSQPPNFSVSVDSITSTTDSTFTVWFTSNGLNTTENYFLVALGNDSDVSASTPNSYIYYEVTALNPSVGIHGSDQIFASDLEYAGFKSGMTAYLILYPLSHYTPGIGEAYSSYYDIASQRIAFTSLGAASKVFRVTIP